MVQSSGFTSVVVVHCKGAAPEASWYPWLKAQLVSQQIECIVPSFPPEDDSKLVDWFTVFDTLHIDLSHTAFVAHARGAMALLRWVDQLPHGVRIPRVVTVSTPFDYQPGRNDADELYATPLDYNDLREKCGEYILIHSADDPYVPIAASEELAAKLDGRLVRYETAGHFGSDKLEAPEIIRELIG